ncbi:hypothetical protein TNCT_431941 [Trichonephila clavata]|uniref:Uncharacterized protein n=1 Tax=Trichonephila clavata TaxID=2740835 RepID=A0A8X6LAI8_TRICU|nr:hypothetical protein TNCT_431941 [Trichonephila clavata]
MQQRSQISVNIVASDWIKTIDYTPHPVPKSSNVSLQDSGSPTSINYARNASDDAINEHKTFANAILLKLEVCEIDWFYEAPK